MTKDLSILSKSTPIPMKDNSPLKQNFRYLPLYPEIDGWGARVLSAGYVETPAGAPYPAPGHPDDHNFTWESGRRLQAHAFLYITAGEGIYESEAAGVLPVKAGDALIVFPGVWHRYRPLPETGWREHWVEATGSLLELAVERAGFSPRAPVIYAGHDSMLLSSFNEVIETIGAQPPGFQALVGIQSVMIIAKIRSLAQTLRDAGDPGDAVMVRKAILVMAENLDGFIDWPALTARLGRSYTSFRRVFRKTTGRAPGDYFTEMKINRAKQLLTSSSRSIQEIATLLGFDTSSHFSHLFKARTGLSPRGFRKGETQEREE